MHVKSHLRNVHTLDNWHDGSLLDSGRSLEAICIDSAQEFALEVHSIEAVSNLIIVGLDLTCKGTSHVNRVSSKASLALSESARL